jgi:serine/threonine protein kinase
VWIGAVIIPSVLAGLCAFAAFVAWGIRLLRARRERMTARLLHNFVDINSGAGGGARKFGGDTPTSFVDKDLVIDFDKLDILREIGAGATGIVLLATWRRHRVAVKRLYPRLVCDKEGFVREALLHKSLRHPNVVQLVGVSLHPLAVILEFMARGTLFAVLHDETIVLSFPKKTSFISDVARACQFLHSSAIIHRDLKSLNVLVNEDWRCKIADFGAAKTAGGGLMTGIAGTLLWAAPVSLIVGIARRGGGEMFITMRLPYDIYSISLNDSLRSFYLGRGSTAARSTSTPSPCSRGRCARAASRLRGAPPFRRPPSLRLSSSGGGGGRLCLTTPRNGSRR